MEPGTLRRTVLAMLGLSDRDRIHAILMNCGTADVYYNSLVPDGAGIAPGHLIRNKERFLEDLAVECGAVIVESGPGFAHYNGK